MKIFNQEMKKTILAIVLNIFLSLSALAQSEIPEAIGHVHDYANKLNQDELDTLNTMLHMYYKRTTGKIAVVMEKDSDEDPFDRSLNYARTWKVGTKDSNNGLLFYINLNKRKTFVQVANKLQGTLNDGKIGEILRNEWNPNAKNSQYYLGIKQTITVLMTNIEGKTPPPVTEIIHFKNPNQTSTFNIPFFVHLIALIIIAIQVYSLRFDLKGAKKLKQVEKGELVL